MKRPWLLLQKFLEGQIFTLCFDTITFKWLDLIHFLLCVAERKGKNCLMEGRGKNSKVQKGRHFYIISTIYWTKWQDLDGFGGWEGDDETVSGPLASTKGFWTQNIRLKQNSPPNSEHNEDMVTEHFSGNWWIHETTNSSFLGLESLLNPRPYPRPWQKEWELP